MLMKSPQPITVQAPKKKKKYKVNPGHLARCIRLSGDVYAGVLLYTVYGRWLLAQGKEGEPKKKAMLHRDGVAWIAMSRADWCIASGLKLHQLRKVAIPQLKTRCGQFMRFERWRVNPSQPVQLWISLDTDAMYEAFNESYHESLVMANEAKQ